MRRQLVFLHYFGGSSRAWREVIDGLEDSGCLTTDLRCIAPDLRGFGDTDAPKSGYTLDAYTDDVFALVEAYRLSDVVLAGHSMGSKSALNVAARKPRWLHALLLVAPSPPTAEPMADDEWARLLATHGDPQAALQTITTITKRSLSPSLIEQAVTDNLRTSPAAWRAWLEQGRRDDISARMERIDGQMHVAYIVLLNTYSVGQRSYLCCAACSSASS